MSRDTKLATGIRADSFSDKGFTNELEKAQGSGFSRGILYVCGAFFLAIFLYIFTYAVKTTYHWHDDRPTAQLACGPVVGVYDDVNYLVTAFKAIPYGASPTNEKRWQPSTPKYNSTNGSCWNGTLDATSYGAICYQYGYQTFSVNQSEDCLNLDVWTKNLDKSKPLLPTVFWIHGGRNNYGSSHSYRNLEDFIRNRDVCIVAPNYRLNVFGFLSLSELDLTDSRNVSGNYGITDLVLALQWVQSNAASFGCDPNSVTLMGHGSGGTDALALFATLSAKGLFHKAIVLSGSPNISMSRTTANNYNRVLLNNTSCWNATNVASCLRVLTPTQLLAAIPSNWLQTSFWPTDPSGLNLPGLVIVDGKTVTKDLFSALVAAQTEVPLFLSSVKDELELWANTTVINKNATDYNAFLNASFQPWGASVGANLSLQYASVTNQSVARSFYDLSTDLGLLCGHIALLRAYGENTQTQIYHSVVNQGPSTPVPVSATSPAPADPFHLWDFMILFNSWGYFEATQTSIWQAGGGSVAAFKPTQVDQKLGSQFADQLFTFINSTDGTIPYLTTFNGDQDYMNGVYTSVLQGNGNSTRAVVTQYRKSYCDTLSAWQLNNMKYWWVN